MGRAWPLVGRDQEIRFISDVCAGRLGGVVIAGQAGVGKTRLVREILLTAESSGMKTEWVVASTELSAIPLGVFAQHLAGKAEDRDDPFMRVLSALTAQGDAGGLLVAVDDAHLLDATSLALVQQAMRSRAFTCLLTMRSGEPGAARLAPLWKDEIAERIELQPLSRTECEDLLTQVLDGPIEERTFLRLWESSGGNVLFLRELVTGGLERGVLQESAGIWHADRDLVGSDDRLLEVIAARIGSLRDGEREALDILGIAGRVGLALMDQLVGRSEVEALERRGLLNVEVSGRRHEVAPSHPLYGEVARQHIQPLRGISLKARLADAIEAHGMNRRWDVVTVARWRLESSTPASSSLFMNAARLVSRDWAGDVASAIHHGSRVERTDHPTALWSEENSEELAARLALASFDAGGGVEAAWLALQTLRVAGRLDDVDRVFEWLYEHVESDSERADLLVRRGLGKYRMMGDREGAEEFLDRARQLTDDPIELLHIERAPALIAMEDGRSDEMIRLTERLVTSPSVPLWDRAFATGIRAWGMAMAGRTRVAASLCDESLRELWEELGQIPADVGDLLVSSRMTAAFFGGDLKSIRGLLDIYETSPFMQRSAEAIWTVALARGYLELLTGRVRTAARHFGEAVLAMRVFDMYLLPWVLAGSIQAWAMAGEVTKADEMLSELQQREPLLPRFEGYAVWARAWAAVASGNTSAGADLLLEGAADSRSRSQFALEAIMLDQASRLGRARETLPRLAELADGICDAAWMQSFVDFAAGVVSDDGHALDRASEALEEIGAILWAAEASALGSESHRRASLVARANAAATRAHLLASRCEGVHTPILARMSEPESLTQREREIARLAASGLSDKEIAEILVLSPRTVQSHLYSVYAKLGTRGRADLAALLGPQ